MLLRTGNTDDCLTSITWRKSTTVCDLPLFHLSNRFWNIVKNIILIKCQVFFITDKSMCIHVQLFTALYTHIFYMQHNTSHHLWLHKISSLLCINAASLHLNCYALPIISNLSLYVYNMSLLHLHAVSWCT